MKKRVFAFLAMFIMLSFCIHPFSVYADYYITDTEISEMGIPKTYEFKGVLGVFDEGNEFNNPQDIFIEKNGLIYVADTDNDRVVVFDSDNRIIMIIEGEFGENSLPLNKPQGVFVDNDGDVFIADTDNGRILHLDRAGDFIEEFFAPKEDEFDRSYAFRPSKIALDDMGTIYLTNVYDYHGIIAMNGKNEFLGYLGTTKIGFDFTEWVVRLFSTKEQKELLAKKMPAYFSNFIIDGGLIYATSYWDKTNQIKKLTPSGNNIMKPQFYGEKNEDEMFNKLPGFADIAVDSNGTVYAADIVSGKIYVYDSEGRNLSVFGGTGRRAGHFETISSIALDSSGILYVLDQETGLIQVFAPTELMKNILLATALYNEGKYDETSEPWGRVLTLDANNLLANIGMAKVAFNKGQYKESMELYMNSFDRSGYSDAFSDFRLDLFRQYFIYIVLAVTLFIVLFWFAVSRFKRYADAASNQSFASQQTFGARGIVKTAALMIAHPIDCSFALKRSDKKIKWIHALIFLIAIILVRGGYIYIVHFPLASFSLLSVDIFQQLLFMMLPLVSFIIVGFGITSISDGKQSFVQMAYTVLASFTPYILFQWPIGFFSHLLAGGEHGFYSILSNLIMLWCLILLLLSMKLINEYSIGQLVSVVVKTVFGIICLWMLVLLSYIILVQAFGLFETIYKEFSTL